jgi:hypothetical protein
MPRRTLHACLVNMLAVAVSLVAALGCRDATAPLAVAVHDIRPSKQLVIPSIPSATPQISAGYWHSCALKTDGTVVCWGRNTSGETTVPSGLASVVQVSAGYEDSCALKNDGTVACWGSDILGETDMPSGLGSVAQLSSNGQPYTCALKTDGTVACWGDNTYGESAVPAGLASVTQVSAGGYAACALKTDGTVVCWGGLQNTSGQEIVPPGLTSVVQVSAGTDHTCAVKTDGTVVCWGANVSGESIVPPGIGPVAQVSAGYPFTCALQTGGTVGCWGNNQLGQSTVPSGLASVVQVSAAINYSCALKTDGTVACWGDNTYGQLNMPAGLNLIVSAGPAPQTISFTSTAPSPGYRTDTYAVSAAATSGLAVTFSTSTPAKCSVSGSTVTFTAVGTCLVAADQAGNAAYLAAPEQTQSITVVHRLKQTISFTSVAPDSAYAGATYAVSATATSGLPVSFKTSTPGKCSVSGGAVSFAAAGTCTVVAEQAGDATYRAAPKERQSITIVKQPQTITFTSTVPSPADIGATYAVTATATSGLPVSFKTSTPGKCSVSGSTVTFTAGGTCVVAAEQGGDSAYLAAPKQTQSITVAKQP